MARQRRSKAPRELLAIHYAQGGNDPEAREKFGVSQSTLSRLMLEPDFVAQITAIRAGFVEHGARLLEHAFSEAVVKLKDLMHYADSQTVQLNAAKGIVDAMLKVRENVTMMQRMQEIERRLGIIADLPPCPPACPPAEVPQETPEGPAEPTREEPEDGAIENR